MDYIGIDVHANESQICTLTDQGEILELRVRTRPERFAKGWESGPGPGS